MELTNKERELIELYRKADACDKEAIRLLLNKYRSRMIYLRIGEGGEVIYVGSKPEETDDGKNQ